MIYEEHQHAWIIAFFNNSIIVHKMILECYANIFVPIAYIISLLFFFSYFIKADDVAMEDESEVYFFASNQCWRFIFGLHKMNWCHSFGSNDQTYPGPGCGISFLSYLLR